MHAHDLARRLLEQPDVEVRVYHTVDDWDDIHSIDDVALMRYNSAVDPGPALYIRLELGMTDEEKEEAARQRVLHHEWAEEENRRQEQIQHEWGRLLP